MNKFILTILLTILCTAIAVSQIKVLEAHAISIDRERWELCDPPIKIIVTNEKITIYSMAPQEYITIATLSETRTEDEISNTWLCVDGDGTRCHITVGAVSNDLRGYYMLIEYSDHKWMYRCYLKQ